MDQMNEQEIREDLAQNLADAIEDAGVDAAPDGDGDNSRSDDGVDHADDGIAHRTADQIVEFVKEAIEEARAKPDELKVGDYVEWNASGNRARGRIKKIVRDGEIDVPGSSFVIKGTADNPAALIAIVRDGEETDIMAGHRFSALKKIAKPQRNADAEMMYRDMHMDMKPINEENRRVRIAVSSEEPVMRGFGYEVLEHSERAIDLSFLASGRAPLLLDHDPEKQIGVVESIELDGDTRRLRAMVRFGRNGLAKEAFDDVVDGIRGNISVGYQVNKMEKDEKRDNTYRVTSWRPMECSLVSIPADTSVGVGRSAGVTSQQDQAERTSQEPVIKTDFKETKMSEVDIAAVEAEARKAAQKNAAQIVELGARHNKAELARSAIAEGKTIEEFRGLLLDEIGSKTALESTDMGLTKKEVRNFSLIRLINAMANPQDRRAQEAAAFEFEVGQAAARHYGKDPQGIFLPNEVLSKRALNSADEADLFSDDFRGSEFIDVLRNASSVMQAGARMLSGLSGDVAIPKKATAAAAAWIATEGADSAESEMTTSTVTMTPKQLGAHTIITRQLRQQSSMDVENLVRDDLANALALAIDLAALRGTGASGAPTGIKSTAGINVVDFGVAPITVPSFAKVVEMETAVAADNALMGNLAYILGAAMYGGLKTTEKATGTAQFVVEPGGTMNGYRTIVSNQVEAGDLYFGNFADLLVGMWSGVDLIVDPYTQSKSGSLVVTALQTVDVAVRHAVSFALGNDGGS